jgi:iron complex outermembrane recepter protein
MVTRTQRRFAWAVLSPFLAVASAIAQETEEQKERAVAEEEVVVTGSRIRRKDLTTPAPVTVFTRKDIDESGRSSLGEFLQLMPEQGNAPNAQVNNRPGPFAGDGSTRIGLRSLGENRTLVLLNGRRFVPENGGADPSIDLNSVPDAAIERVEVLKDGAAAVYGSDSIGGVVNIITRRRFDGTEVRAYTGLSTRADGQTYRFDATTGRTSDRGALLFSATYFKQEPVWARDRSFSQYALAYDATTGSETRSGSGVIPQGRIIIPREATGQPVPNPTGDPRIDLYNSLVTTYPNENSFTRDRSAPLGWRPFAGNALAPDGDGYNFQPYNYDFTPSQRISAFSTGELKLTSNARGYYEGSFANRQATQQLAPEPLFTDVVSKDNFYNPFGVDIATVRRRMTEWGNRLSHEDVTTYRGVVGIDGTIPERWGPFSGWFWDVSLSYGRSQQSGTITGTEDVNHLQAALGPSWTDAAGRPHCGTDSAHDITGCEPLDLFHGPGTVTAAQTAYATFTGITGGVNELTSVQANASGELFRLFADRPVALGIGYEYRHAYTSFAADALTLQQNFGAPNTSGGYYVNEGYAELSLPIISGAPAVTLVEALAAVRAFDYSTAGSGWTYKVGGRWTIVPDLTLRGTYSTAFRAPSIFELFTPSLHLTITIRDPCSGPIDPASSLAKQCGPAVNNGAGFTDTSYTTGGNSALKPETAKVATAGFVFQPRFASNLSITADYYRISMTDTISNLGPDVVANGCPGGDPTAPGVTPALCGSIERDPQTHVITRIVDPNINVGATTTDGVDLAVRYAIPSPLGRFSLFFDGTWLHKLDQTLPDGTIVHARGTYDARTTLGAVNPAVKFVARANWALAGFSAVVNTRYFSSFTECGDSTGSFGGLGVCSFDDTFQRRVHSYNAWDVSLGYALKSGFGRTEFVIGVNNVFDATPPLIYNAFWPTSDPTAYDFMGRFVYANVRHTF